MPIIKNCNNRFIKSIGLLKIKRFFYNKKNIVMQKFNLLNIIHLNFFDITSILFCLLLENNGNNWKEMLLNYFECIFFSSIILKICTLVIKTLQNLAKKKVLDSKTIQKV